MSRRFDIDEMARLEEQRDDLLAGLDRIDAELQRGELDGDDHAVLRDDLTIRAAAVIRQLDDTVAVRVEPARTSTARKVWVGLGLAVLALAAGIAVASSSGLRLAGQGSSGEIDQSSRDLLLQAEVAFGSGEFDLATESIDEVLDRVPDDLDALVLRARVQEQRTELLAAIMTLDQVLALDPDSTDGLTLKGWILVRLPDDELVDEGIRLLDRAIALEPAEFDAYLFRAVTAAEKEGDLEAAIKYYREVLDHNPPQQMVSVVESRIAELSAAAS